MEDKAPGHNRQTFLIILLLYCLIWAIFIPLGRASELEKSDVRVSGGVDIRLRNELWGTFERQGVQTDRTYDFFLIRARGFIDIIWKNLSIHVMGQGVKAFNLPENSAFGLGPLYFNASDQDTGPGNFQIVEAYLHLKDMHGLHLKGGRIGIREGAEVLYGEPKIDWVIKARLSERLSGSGPFNNEAFGYVFNRPVEGEGIETNLGGELDFTLGIKPVSFLTLEIGYSHFFRGGGVDVVFDKED
jgi:hypothetical protein